MDAMGFEWEVSTLVDTELELSFRPDNPSWDRRTSEDPYNVAAVLCSSSSAQEEDRATDCGRTVVVLVLMEVVVPTDPYYHAFWASTSPVFDPLHRDSSWLVLVRRWFAALDEMPDPRAVDWRCTHHLDR